jgi:hypothetical protein
MTVFSITLPLIKELEIHIYNDTLAEFIIRQFKNYTIKTEKKRNANQGYNVDIFSRNDIVIDKSVDMLQEDRILARKIIVNDKKMYVSSSIYTIQNDNFTIISKKKMSLLRRYYRKIKLAEYSFYHSLFYELFLFPVFSIYCMIDGYFLVHGSLLELQGKNILIMGLDGVGKSSLSNELAAKGANILADNFVLFNGNTAVPLNMAMRLVPEQKSDFEILYKDNDLKEILPKTIVNEPVKPDKYILLSISSEIKSTIKKINPGVLPLFLNNAPEIGAANNFIAPFLYMTMYKMPMLIDDLDLQFLEIPVGALSKGVEKIINE